MKLTPAKCVSGVSAGKFLGFMVTQKGIEVNPDQIKAVMATFPLSSKKELQCLTSRLAALGRFITRFTNKLRLFFLTLKGVSTTGWTSDYKEQRLIYYVSKAMVDTEIRYSKMEQTTLTLKSVAQKLHPYFQAHQAIELSEYGIKYQFRLAIKGQVMADFIVEIPQKSSQLARPSENGWWILHVD
ncbi:hypothetical protein CK203_018623 [Vitis vinifera]|uniref:Reverse transcriptase RNase H-like domain-containing protein n=1 Tax=Vitis vinifera TaxID=29760 RepID=A0A438JAR7_VITVI|nr:hypothetical protein CK203_018623 [Vitis vinifera]